VFTARYALSPYIKQIRFVFKGSIGNVQCGSLWSLADLRLSMLTLQYNYTYLENSGLILSLNPYLYCAMWDRYGTAPSTHSYFNGLWINNSARTICCCTYKQDWKNSLSNVVHKVSTGVLCSLLCLLVVCMEVCVYDAVYTKISVYDAKNSGLFCEPLSWQQEFPDSFKWKVILSMFSAVNNFTVSVPTIEQKLDTNIYNHIVSFLPVSTFSGHLKEKSRERKTKHWLIMS
jgi:hypothetical protein